MASAITGVLASATAAQQPAIEALDPASIDLSQPTLFLVPYTHLDDMWRWSYPQTIRDFLRNTLYEYGHLFAYRLDIPVGATSITLPESPFVRMVAMSVGDEGHAVALQSPFTDLSRDNAFYARFNDLRTLPVNN